MVKGVGSHTKKYDNLPGSIIDFKDGVGGLGSDDVVGKNVVLIGTALDGPTLEPVSVDDYDDVEDVFGPYYDSNGTRNGATLTYGAKRMFNVGADNVTLMRIGGKKATGELEVDGRYETEVRQTREYFGEALGNAETKIDLFEREILPEGSSLSSEDLQYRSYYQANNVRVFVNGEVISSDKYRVDNDNGIVTLRENSVASESPIEVEFDLTEIDYTHTGYTPVDTPYSEDYHTLNIISDEQDGIKVSGFDDNASIDSNNDDDNDKNAVSKITITLPDEISYPLLKEARIEDNDGNIEELDVQYMHLAQKESTEWLSEDDDKNYIFIDEVEKDSVTIRTLKEIDFNKEELTLKYLNCPSSSLEVAELDDSRSRMQFRTKNNDIVKYSERVFKRDSNGDVALLERKESATTSNEGLEYVIDYSTGRINLTSSVEDGEEIVVAYEYDNSETERDLLTGLTSHGQEMALHLNHDASDGNDYPITVLANGDPVEDRAYSVNFENRYNTSVVTLDPGYVEVDDEIEVVYYYEKQKRTEPTIKLEGYYEGSVYNSTQILIKDTLYEIESHIEYKRNKEIGEKGIKLTNEGNGTYTFRDQIIIGTDSFEVPFNRLSYLIQDLELVYWDTTKTDDGDRNYTTISLNEDDVDINAETGTITFDTEKDEYDKFIDAEYDVYATEAYFVTEDEKVSFARDEVMERISSTLFEFQNSNIVEDVSNLSASEPVKLYVKKNDGTIKVLDYDKRDGRGDYDVDFSTGTVQLRETEAIADHESLIAQRYAYYNVNGKELTIVKPRGKTEDDEEREIVIGVDNQIQTIGQLVDEINDHNRNNVVKAKIDNSIYADNVNKIVTPTNKLENQGAVYGEDYAEKRVTLGGGADEINMVKDKIYDKLGGVKDSRGNKIEKGAYDILNEVEEADIVVPLGVYADDDLAVEYHNFANQLAQFLTQSFYHNNEIRGMIGVKPIEYPSRLGVINRVEELEDLQTLFFLEDEDENIVEDRDGNPIDVGKFITIVGHDVLHSDNNLAYETIENGVVEFAGATSMLDADNAPTNETLPEVKVPYPYSKKQANALSGNRIVTFKRDGGEVKIADSPTCSFPNSGWNRYLTVNIVFDTIDKIRAIYDRYIGKGNSLEIRNSLESDVRHALEEDDKIKDFDFSLKMNTHDEFMGRVVIPLKLVPMTELRRIETVVSINAQI